MFSTCWTVSVSSSRNQHKHVCWAAVSLKSTHTVVYSGEQSSNSNTFSHFETVNPLNELMTVLINDDRICLSVSNLHFYKICVFSFTNKAEMQKKKSFWISASSLKRSVDMNSEVCCFNWRVTLDLETKVQPE